MGNAGNDYMIIWGLYGDYMIIMDYESYGGNELNLELEDD